MRNETGSKGEVRMRNKIAVRMGEGVVARAPHIIISLGLGSCVTVVLYDTKRRIGGLAHIMLPESDSLNGRYIPYQCADTAIAALLEQMQSKGAILRDIVAKMVGGAQMFSSYDGSSPCIGKQNIISIKDILKREGIPLIAEDTGGHHGRNIEFHLDSGKLVIKAVGKEVREI